jgi:hypothetical protein
VNHVQVYQGVATLPYLLFTQLITDQQGVPNQERYLGIVAQRADRVKWDVASISITDRSKAHVRVVEVEVRTPIDPKHLWDELFPNTDSVSKFRPDAKACIVAISPPIPIQN